MTMDFDYSQSEVSEAFKMNFDSASSGYGSGIQTQSSSNGYSPSEITNSTFVSDSSLSNEHSNVNQNNSRTHDKGGGEDKEHTKEPLTKVLSTTSC